MVFLILFTLSFSIHANNPILNEVEKLDIEGLLECQQQRDQIEIDFYFKKQKDKEERYRYSPINISHQHHWNKSEQIILRAQKRFQALQDKLSTKGDWGEIKLDIKGLKKKPNANLEYKYGF